MLFRDKGIFLVGDNGAIKLEMAKLYLLCNTVDSCYFLLFPQNMQTMLINGIGEHKKHYIKSENGYCNSQL